MPIELDYLQNGDSQRNEKDSTKKIEKFFKNGCGKGLSIKEASNFLRISPDELVDLAFKFEIRFHIGNGKLLFFKNELARWKWQNPTLLIRARTNTGRKKHG